jgi:hypothetical protein
MNKLVRGAMAAAVAVGSLAAAPSAMAAVGDGSCTYSEACVFKLTNYSGGLADIGTNDSDWHNNYFTTGGNAHNSGSSGFGQDRAMQYYGAVGWSGRWFLLGASEWDPHWSTNQAHTLAEWKSFNFDNQISANSIFVP